jgi:hypothetical protein
MRSPKKNSRIAREEKADQKYLDLWMDRAEDKVRPNGERSPGRTPLLDLRIPAQEGARPVPANEIPACVVTVKEAKHQAEC